MDIFTPSTYPPVLLYGGAIISFVLFSMAYLLPFDGSKTIGDCICMILWSTIFAMMWPVIWGIVFFFFGVVLVGALTYAIYYPVAKVLSPVLNYKV